MAAIPPTPTPNLVLPAGGSRVGLPILIQLMDERQHGMPRRAPPILTLQTAGKHQLGTRRHGPPIHTHRTEVGRLLGMQLLARRILIPVAALQQEGGVIQRVSRVILGVDRLLYGPPVGMLPHRLLERRRLQQHRRPVHMVLTMPPLLLPMSHHGKAAVVVLLRHLYPLQRQAYCLCHMITMGFRNMFPPTCG